MLVRQQRRCPTRVLAALVAVALVFAHVVGAYAHAAGHNLVEGPSFSAQQNVSAPGGSGINAHAHGDHSKDPASNVDAFDFMCNGGLAIAVGPYAAFTEAKATHSSTVLQIVHLLLASSLERPPKSALRA
jgi:hypothetical protein